MLDDERLLKTGEAEKGIQRLLAECSPEAPYPAQLNPYLSVCRSYAAAGMYAGSPELERCLMRNGDMLVLSELHTAEIDVLRTNMEMPVLYGDGISVKPQIHHRNGYEMIKALTPPVTKRGLVLIDPSYEDVEEYAETAACTAFICRRWSIGIIMVWYPLLSHRRNEIANMKRTIKAAVQSVPSCDMLDAQLLINAADSHTETNLAEAAGAAVPRLYGSGMLIINPPWKLDEELRSVLPFLSEKLSSDGSWSIV